MGKIVIKNNVESDNFLYGVFCKSLYNKPYTRNSIQKGLHKVLSTVQDASSGTQKGRLRTTFFQWAIDEPNTFFILFLLRGCTNGPFM